MASEIRVALSLVCSKLGITKGGSVGRALEAILGGLVTSNIVSQGVMTVSFSVATAIPIGAMTAPGWCFLINLDSTNFISIRNGSSGADVCELRAGEPACFPWRRTATPYALADTANCGMEFLILSR